MKREYQKFINKTKKQMSKIKSILSVFLFGGLMVSCNSDSDDLGKNLFDGNSVTGNQVSYDLVTYNINNGDVVRADSYAHWGLLLRGSLVRRSRHMLLK